MKYIISIFILFAVISFATPPLQSALAADKKEMLVSLPYLSEKNASIIDRGLKSSAGIIGIQSCYDLKVMIISYDPKIVNEEIILQTMRSLEINSSVELMYHSDINKIRSTYAVTTIR